MKLSLLAFASSALALAIPGGDHYGWGCLSQEEAETLVARYSAVIGAQPSDLGGPALTARAITAPGYSETSDSANIQLGIPLGSVTVPTKQAFVIGSQSNPPLDTTTIAVYVTDCSKITWQWNQLSFGTGQYEVKGFHLFSVGDDGRLTSAFFEFNSFAGALDTGYTIFYPNGTQFGV